MNPPVPLPQQQSEQAEALLADGAAAPASSGTPYTGLGGTAVRGFAWMLAQTMSSKVLGLAGQLVLAWLLDPTAFGLVALAYAVNNFVLLIDRSGLREVLVHRHRHFRRWATPGFWMSLASGLAAAMLLVAAAPLAAWVWGERGIMPLLLVLAIAAPLNALGIVPMAHLSGQLRFRLLAQINLLNTIGQTALTVTFAALGAGALSFVLPRPIMAAVVAVVAWVTARPRVQLRPMLRRWRFLITDTGVLVAASFLTILAYQTDYMLLGRVADAQVVGLYYFAFQLSLQATSLLTAQIPMVLFPVFTKLTGEPARQLTAFIATIRVLALMTVPICVLQAVAAHPLIALLPAKWEGVAILLLILSLGSAFRVFETARDSLLQSHGRFRTILWLALIRLGLFIVLLIAGWWIGGVVGVAAAFTLASMIAARVGIVVALRPIAASRAEAGLRIGSIYWTTLLPPLAAAGLAALPAVGLGLLAGQWLNSAAVDLAVRVIVFCSVAGGLWWWLYREDLLQVLRLLRLRRGGEARSAAP